MEPICSFPDCGIPLNGKTAYGLCAGHYGQVQRGQSLRPILRGEGARFWAKVEKTETCWNWTGTRHSKGYGRIKVGNQMVAAHRWAWESIHGLIPDGLTLDHLCRNPSCVNPAHLEPVTSGVNTLRGGNPCAENARKMHCKRGHEFTPDNTYWNIYGKYMSRVCRTCSKARKHRRRGV